MYTPKLPEDLVPQLYWKAKAEKRPMTHVLADAVRQYLEKEQYPMIVRMTKKENKLLRWLQKAIANDVSRPALNGVNVNGAMVTCDGFRLHATRHILPALAEGDNAIVEFDAVRAGQELAEPAPVPDCTYPDIHSIVPTTEPELSVYVNRKYLQDAIAMADGKDGRVRLVFRGDTSPVEVYGRTSDDEPCYALVMPIYQNRVDAMDYAWKPTRPIDVNQD